MTRPPPSAGHDRSRLWTRPPPSQCKPPPSYRVIWLGYDAQAATWEPASNIGSEILAEYVDGVRREAELEDDEDDEDEDEGEGEDGRG